MYIFKSPEKREEGGYKTVEWSVLRASLELRLRACTIREVTRPYGVHAALQRKMAAEGRKLSIITQNIDRLHQVHLNGPTSMKPMSVVS